MRRHRAHSLLSAAPLLLTLCLWISAAPALACENCKNSVADPSLATGNSAQTSDTGIPVGYAFSYSVLFMMGTVLALPAGMAGLLYFNYRRYAPRGLNDTSKSSISHGVQ